MSTSILYKTTHIELNYGSSILINSPDFILNDEIISITQQYYFKINSISSSIGLLIYDINSSNNIKINELNGSIIINNTLNIDIYNVNIICFINNENINALITIIIKPKIYYEPKIFNYGDLIYLSPILDISHGIFECNHLLDLSSNFSFNNGIISNHNIINIGIYNYHIKYTINNISNYSIVNFIVQSIYFYDISSIIMNYGENIFSCKPNVYPQNGLFNLNSVTNGINININTGILNFNNVNEGIYNIKISYVINRTINNTFFNIIIYPIIYYSNNLELDYGSCGYSETPYISNKIIQGFFTFDLSQNKNLLSTIVINNSSGILTFDNNIDIGKYTINIFYKKNNITISTIYNLTINPIYYYTINTLTLNYGTFSQSCIPIYSCDNNKGYFNIIDNIDNITIDQSGIIYFSFLDVNQYNIELEYILNNCTKKIIFVLKIIPTLYIIDNLKNINYGDTMNPTQIYYSPNGGNFTINNNLININENNIIDFTNFNKNYVDNYLIENEINITYTINNLFNILNASFQILPKIIYNNNIKSIIYKSIDNSEIPIIIPNIINNGIYSGNFPDGITINKINGIIYFDQTILIGIYSLIINYTFLNNSKEIIISTEYLLSINPLFYYRKNIFEFVYCDNILYLGEPIIEGNTNLIFNFIITANSCNIIIDLNTGILTIPSNLNVGTYIINININNNNTQLCATTSINIIINKLELIPNFKCINKIYDGTINAIIDYSCMQILKFDAFYDNFHIGKLKKIFITNIILIENMSNNYYINNTIIFGDILIKEIIPILTAIPKYYDGNFKANITYSLNEIYDKLIMNYTASYINKFSGENKLINITNIVLLGDNLHNYSIKNDYIIYGIINKLTITANFIGLNKIYDLTCNARTEFESLSGLINNDRIYFISYDSEYENADVGLQKKIIIKNFKMDNEKGNSYMIIPNIPYSDINPLLLQPKIMNINKIYDNTNNTNIQLLLDSSINIMSFDSYYDNKNTALNKQIFINNIILSNSNYYIKNLITNGNIIPKKIDIIFNFNDKIFNNSNNVDISYCNLHNIFNDDDIYISNYDAKFRDINSCKDKEILITNIKLGGIDSKNYQINSIIKNKPTILLKEMKIKFNSIDKIYDNNTNALINLDLKSKKIIKFKGNYEDMNVGNNKIINITDINIDDPNYYINDNIIFGNINPKPIILILSINDKIYDGLTTASIKINEIKGIYLNDNIYVTGYSANFIDPNIGTKSVSIVNIILGGKSMQNYYCPDINSVGNII